MEIKSQQAVIGGESECVAWFHRIPKEKQASLRQYRPSKFLFSYGTGVSLANYTVLTLVDPLHHL